MAKSVEIPSGKSATAAHWNLTPRRSHVFLTGLLLSGLLCTLAGTAFLWADKFLGFVPMGIGISLMAIAVYGWWTSRADVDLDGAAPTIIKQHKDGFELSTDTRMLSGGRQRAALFSNILEIAANRQQLPAPDGLVTATGEPVPTAVEEARRRIESINQQIDNAGAAVFKALRAEKEGQVLLEEAPNDPLIATHNAIDAGSA